jgi:hypothetical protein
MREQKDRIGGSATAATALRRRLLTHFSTAVHRQADRAGQELCCSGRYRHRERAVAERVACG